VKRAVTCVLLSCLLCCLSRGASSADFPFGFQVPLFDGSTLAGWHAMRCSAVVQDGAILLKSGDGILRTDSMYDHFVLELQWKALKQDKWDSGIYFRFDELPGKTGRPWPQRYQINLRQGQEGWGLGLKGAKTSGLVKDGQWNHFKLTVVGDTAALEINGKKAWRARGLETKQGYIALQSEVPLGGQFLFRNIKITELRHRPLYSGHDLSGCEPADGKPTDIWKADDGQLVCTGDQGPWLRSTKQFGDFNLRLEYRLPPGGNSGVFIRVPKSGAIFKAGAGIEVQVLDDAAKKYAKLKPYQYSGSLYALVPASPRVALPAGEWNRLEINADGHHYRVRQNGHVVVDATPEDVPKLKERLLKGYLGLQNHSSEVRYRRIRLGPPLR